MNPKNPKSFACLFACVCFVICSGFFVPINQSDGQNLLTNFKPREIGPTIFGGRVVDIEVDTHAPHRIFVASASGGLFLSENNGTSWTNIFEQESTLSIGDIAVDANDSRIVWIGTGEANNQRSSLWGNGIYKTTDRGKTWTHLGLTDTQHIGRIVIDPKNSDTVYVAALGHLYSSNEERGLFKTTDGGKTWEKILYVNEDVGVVDLVIDPNDPKNLYAATYERLRRAWNFDGAGPGSAIYKSPDGGKTWKKLTKGLPSGEIGRIGLAIYAKNPKILYATVSNQNLAPARPARQPQTSSKKGKAAKGKGTKGKGTKNKAAKEKSGDQESKNDIVKTPFGFNLRKTDEGFFVTGLAANHPARRTGFSNRSKVESMGGIDAKDAVKLTRFLQDLKPSDRVELIVKSKDKSVRITITAPATRQSAARQIGGEVFRSDDAGESWKKVNRQPVGGSPAYYYGQIRIDPKDEKRLYILSVPMHTSTDGGVSWSTAARSVHVDHHALWINPQSPNHIMLGNDGGFHQSYDYGQTMDHYFNIPMSQFYALTVDMQEPYHIYGGTQDNGSWGGPSRGAASRRGRGGISPFQWYRIGGGDGFYVQVDPKDHNFFVAESQFGAIFKANRETGSRKSIRPRPVDPKERYRFNWNSPILMSQHDSRIIYFGGNKLFKSMNQGDDWEEISGDLTSADPEKIKGNVPFCTITTIAESAKDRKLLLVGTDDGKIQLTRDGGKSWTDLSGNFPFRPGDWWCSRVELSHHDPNTAFAAFTGYREDDFRCFVYKSTDLGETWNSIAGNLPQESVNVIKEDRVNPNVLYLGSEFGCYVTTNGGVHWDGLEGVPRVSVHDLIVHPRDQDLVLGTHGRGFFVVDDITPLQQLHQKSDDATRLFNPRIVKSYRSSPSPSISGDRQFFGANPRESGRIWYQVQSKSDDSYELTVSDASGKQVFKATAKRNPGLHFVPVNIGRSSQRRGGPTGRPRSTQQGSGDTVTVTAGTYSITLENKKTSQKQTSRLVVE